MKLPSQAESLRAGGIFKKGDTIGGQFEIYKLLGQGGFGQVYLAWNREALSVCALKTIRTDLLANAASREGFKKEALLWVNLEQHPFILAARLVKEFSRRLFVSTDYIPHDARGRVSLVDHLAKSEGPLDGDRALEWAIQFCYGMEHADRRGMKTHQDIKPSNILITPDGMLKISDFGLATGAVAALRNTDHALVTGGAGEVFGFSLLQVEGNKICGTPGYIAPELFLGKEADVRSDVYSFGLVLWQMAKGSPLPPFHIPYEGAGNIEGYLRAVFEQQMKGRVPHVGGPMQSAIERCLAPEPSRRYANFEELRRELEPVFHRRTGRVVELPKGKDRTAGFWDSNGISLDELGRHEEALDSYSKALEIDPQNAYAWSNKGTALWALGRHKEAIDCLAKALEIDPRFAAAWGNKGTVLHALGRLEEAIACFDKALEIDPRLADAWNGKGVTLSKLGRQEQAIACFTHALEIDPRLANAWSNKGFVFITLRREEEAMACFTKAEEIDPECADDCKHILGQLGEHEAALASSQQGAIDWNSRGGPLIETGRTEEAIACYTKALEIDDRFGAAWYNKGSALSLLGRYEEAIACYTQALKVDPYFADSWGKKGHALGLLGRYEEAIVCLTSALDIDRQKDAAWNNKGKALNALGRHEDAISCYVKALEIDPRHAFVWDNKGIALRSLGRHEEAIDCHSKALEIDPRYVEAWCNKGLALHFLGREEEANDCLSKAVELDPYAVAAWKAVELDPHGAEISDADIPF